MNKDLHLTVLKGTVSRSLLFLPLSKSLVYCVSTIFPSVSVYPSIYIPFIYRSIIFLSPAKHYLHFSMGYEMNRSYQYFIPFVLNYSDKNNQHKIKLKTTEMHSAKHVQLTTNWQKNPIFLTAFQLPHPTWEIESRRHGGRRRDGWWQQP